MQQRWQASTVGRSAAEISRKEEKVFSTNPEFSGSHAGSAGSLNDQVTRY